MNYRKTTKMLHDEKQELAMENSRRIARNRILQLTNNQKAALLTAK